MAEIPLTKEQKRFLEECNLEFSERFTDSDIEYKEVYDAGIPSPPIMCPWHGRQRFNRDRDRDNWGSGGSSSSSSSTSRKRHYDGNDDNYRRGYQEPYYNNKRRT